MGHGDSPLEALEETKVSCCGSRILLRQRAKCTYFVVFSRNKVVNSPISETYKFLYRRGAPYVYGCCFLFRTDISWPPVFLSFCCVSFRVPTVSQLFLSVVSGLGRCDLPGHYVPLKGSSESGHLHFLRSCTSSIIDVHHRP